MTEIGSILCTQSVQCYYYGVTLTKSEFVIFLCPTNRVVLDMFRKLSRSIHCKINVITSSANKIMGSYQTTHIQIGQIVGIPKLTSTYVQYFACLTSPKIPRFTTFNLPLTPYSIIRTPPHLAREYCRSWNRIWLNRIHIINDSWICCLVNTRNSYFTTRTRASSTPRNLYLMTTWIELYTWICPRCM